MRSANVFMSALHLVVIMLVFGIGAFFLAMYFYPNTLFFFINLIINQPQIILKIGLFSLILALLLFIVFYMINKARYLKFNMKGNKYCVDSGLIRTIIERFLKNSYPDKKNKLEICVLPKNKLEIIATVDSLDGQKEFLLDIENKIGKLLSDQLNYHKDFIFTLKSKK